MPSVSAFLIHTVVLFVPAIIAALGGFAAFRLRRSKCKSRIVTFVTAATLLGLLLGLGRSDFSFAVWFAPTLLSILISLQLAATSPLAAVLLDRMLFSGRTLAGSFGWCIFLVIASPFFLAGGLWQLESLVNPQTTNFDGLKNFQAVDLEEMTEVSAYTDRGQRVPLYKARAEQADSSTISGDQGLPVGDSPLPYRAIRLTEADTASNCTGWVFTGAHAWIQCRDVQTILDDNGYQAVKVARPGDLVIYRDLGNTITHAGCVVALMDDCQPLIESKWGHQGIFVHLPEGSPYGEQWTFYRTPRPNHLLLCPSSEASGRLGTEVAP